MCGICGEMRRSGSSPDLAAVARMGETMCDRGPDGGGAWAQGSVALGHRRLKIIDLSESGSQPMSDPELGLTVVFNGCIYNYPELRRDLERKGYRFFSTSDTEVLLKAYHLWGTGFVDRLKGMFAFAIVEVAAACPPELKLAQGGKGVLKEASRRVIPNEVIDRKKGYFPVPALKHLVGPFLEMIGEALHAPAARERGIFREEFVEKLLAAPNDGKTRLGSNKLWQGRVPRVVAASPWHLSLRWR